MSPGRLLYLTRFYAKRGPRYWYAERFLAPKITSWRLPESVPSTFESVPLHLLTSQHDWRMALWMLASFHHFTGRRWRIVIHEDGSLPDEARTVFSSAFPDATIISRSAADRTMAPILSNHPRCADYRSRMPHGLKCFDIPHHADHDRFLLIDPDVLFFARPDEILTWVDDPDDHSCWFNRDLQEPSPLHPSVARERLGIDLWPQVNSGLCLLTKAAISLTTMEEWLAEPELQDSKEQWRVEQTLLALSASNAASGGTLPSSYEVSPDRNKHEDAKARHYVGCVRDEFYREGVHSLAPSLLVSR